MLLLLPENVSSFLSRFFYFGLLLYEHDDANKDVIFETRKKEKLGFNFKDDTNGIRTFYFVRRIGEVNTV